MAKADESLAKARAHFHEGLRLIAANDWPRAEEELKRSLEFVPDRASTLTNLSVTLLRQHKHQEAETVLRKSLVLDPQNVEAIINLGVLLGSLKRHEEALDTFRKAVALAPGQPDAWMNLGYALQDAGRYDEAADSHERAVQRKPDLAGAWLGLGNACRARMRYDEALAHYEKALEIQPDFAEAWSGRANTLEETRRLEEAADSHDRALKLNPEFAEGHWNKSLFLLRRGEYPAGWREYEWRWKAPGAGMQARGFREPLWLNDRPIKKQTILLHAEQGFGDTIQFCRFVPLVQRLASHVVLEVQGPLASWMRTQFPDASVISSGSALPKFDVHCPLLSLPLAFGITVDTIPDRGRYLRADAEKIEAWTARLGPKTRPRVGIAWTGSRTHRNNARRSVPLKLLETVLTDGFEWVSLQREMCQEDAEDLGRIGRVRQFADHWRDLSDAAALCELMDLVITVDTSIAHLSGALGAKGWVLLNHYPDFRWLWDREDSPWYPSLRLFRQRDPGDWHTVLARVGEEMRGLLESPSAQPSDAAVGRPRPLLR